MSGPGKSWAAGGVRPAAALALLLAACRSSSKPPENAPAKTQEYPPAMTPEPVKVPAGENWMNSTRELGEMVLLALREKNGELLDSLRVTEKEYKEILFPEFPVAAGNNSSPDFHWFLLDQSSRGGIENVLGSWGGEDFELVDVVVTKGIQNYRTYRILSKVELKVKARNATEIRQLRIFGSVVERDGKYKILSYKN